MKTHLLGFTAVAASLALGCGEGSGAETLAPPTSRPSDDAGSATRQPEASVPDADAPGSGDQAYAWRTGQFQLAPGQERYLCFSKAVDEDVTVGAYSSEGLPFVHHVIFARTRTPEPDGFAECDIPFRSSWDPLFISGAGTSKLDFPSDAGHVLKKGTQLLAQMHLLNLSTSPVTGEFAIRLHRSTATNPRPVNSYIFGTMNVHLPPLQTSDVVGQCNMRESVNLIAAFPHMHMLGRAMRFEVGPSLDALQTVFERNPFDFNDQRIDPLVLQVAAGSQARLTCKYDNPNPTEVTYGESTFNEMCYLIGFAVDRATISACIQ